MPKRVLRIHVGAPLRTGYRASCRRTAHLHHTHRVSGYATVLSALDLEASQVRVPAHEHELDGGKSVSVRRDLGTSARPAATSLDDRDLKSYHPAVPHRREIGVCPISPSTMWTSPRRWDRSDRQAALGRRANSRHPTGFPLYLVGDMLSAERRWPAAVHLRHSTRLKEEGDNSEKSSGQRSVRGPLLHGCSSMKAL